MGDSAAHPHSQSSSADDTVTAANARDRSINAHSHSQARPHPHSHAHWHPPSRSSSGSTLSPRVPFQRAGSFDPPHQQPSPPVVTPADPSHSPLPSSPRLRHPRGAGSLPSSSSALGVSHHPAGSTPNHSVDALPLGSYAGDAARTPTLATQHLIDTPATATATAGTTRTIPSPTLTPPPFKEKSSLDMDQDEYDQHGFLLAPTTVTTATTVTGIPDRFNTQTPAFMSSDGDASSHSGPSRTSTPFYGEWGAATDGTDYESAYEGDAVIPMDHVRSETHKTHLHSPHVHSHSHPPSKPGLYIHPSSQSTIHVDDDAAGGPDSLPPRSRRAARRNPGGGGVAAGPGWPSWLTDSIPSRFFGSSKQDRDRYQRLLSTDSPKSPDFPHIYPYSRHNAVGPRDPAWMQPKFHTSMLTSPPQLAVWALRSSQAYLARFHPLTLVATLLFVAGFVTSTTLLIIWILNPDKEPKPWRTFCAQSSPFPHDLADSLAPVDVFVGIMTTDARSDRRAVIRATYGAHTRPVDPITGLETTNVQMKFVMGRPRKHLEHSVALEMEMYNDIVVLDVQENMNSGKTHAFFRWAAENGTVPILVPHSAAATAAATADQAHVGNVGTSADRVAGGLHRPPQPLTAEALAGHYLRGTVHGANGNWYDVAWKKADYVVKADDDAFLRLDELERHLRVSPRKLTYWGYLIRNWFMGGESYAVSADLVEYIATSPYVAAHVKGKEDKVTARWISKHPNASMINYISEHCWIYDHPKSGTAYAHGFLFPDEVERIKAEEQPGGLSPAEVHRRGGEHASKWFSTASQWKTKWAAPASGLSIEEEMEALVEGGGIYRSTGYKSGSGIGGSNDHSQQWTAWSDRVYEAEDARLKELAQGAHHGLKQLPARLRADWNMDEGSHLPFYTRVGNASSHAHGAHEPRGEDAAVDHDDGEDRDHDAANELLDSLPLVGALKHFTAVALGGSDGDGGGDDNDGGKHKAGTTTARSTDGEDSSPAHRYNATEASKTAQRSTSHGARHAAQRRRSSTKIPLAQNAAFLASRWGQVSLDDLQAARFGGDVAGASGGGADANGNAGDVVDDDDNAAAAVGGGGTAPPPSASSQNSTTHISSTPPPSSHHRRHRGGTVVVHFLKRNEWFYETALALIGRDQMRAQSGRGSEWSMWGSPDARAFYR